MSSLFYSVQSSSHQTCKHCHHHFWLHFNQIIWESINTSTNFSSNWNGIPWKTRENKYFIFLASTNMSKFATTKPDFNSRICLFNQYSGSTRKWTLLWRKHVLTIVLADILLLVIKAFVLVKTNMSYGKLLRNQLQCSGGRSDQLWIWVHILDTLEK